MHARTHTSTNEHVVHWSSRHAFVPRGQNPVPDGPPSRRVLGGSSCGLRSSRWRRDMAAKGEQHNARQHQQLNGQARVPIEQRRSAEQLVRGQSGPHEGIHLRSNHRCCQLCGQGHPFASSRGGVHHGNYHGTAASSSEQQCCCKSIIDGLAIDVDVDALLGTHSGGANNDAIPQQQQRPTTKVGGCRWCRAADSSYKLPVAS